MTNEVFTCREFGFEWERQLIEMATSRGYRAVRAEKLREYDVVINGLKVQCKRKNYQDPCGGVRVAKGQKRYAAGDYDILALNFQGRLFFIPSHALQMPGGTMTTKLRLHKVLQYEDKWGVFSEAGVCEVSDQRTLW